MNGTGCRYFSSLTLIRTLDAAHVFWHEEILQSIGVSGERSIEAYSFSTRCLYFCKIPGNGFDSSRNSLLVGIGHELLIIIVRFAPILISTLDPDSPAQRVPGSVFRFLSPATNGNGRKCIRISGRPFVHLVGRC